MNTIYRRLFLYLPLGLTALFFALMAIPHSVIVPWCYVNIWTFLKAFSLAYLLLGGIAMARGLREVGYHLILVGVTVGLIMVACCWQSFGSLYYVVSASHLIALIALLVAVVCAGVLSMSRTPSV